MHPAGPAPSKIVDGQERFADHGRRSQTGEFHDVPVQMGLINIATVGRHPGGILAGHQPMDRMIETDQLGSAFGRHPDLGTEPRPQSLATPTDLVRKVFDADIATSSDDLLPRPGDLRR